jgi:anti-sigma B factor antagonist
MPSQLPPLHVLVRRTKTAAIVTLTGDVGHDTLAKLRDGLDSLHGNVVLDLSGVPFLDSSGLGVITATCTRLRAHGGDLRMRSPQDHVRRVLQRAGLADMVMGGPAPA